MAKPSEIKSPYERLEISQDASQEEIKSAYRRLAHQWHPDKNLGRETESKLEFIAISQAFEELSEEGKEYFERKRHEEGFNSFEMYEEYFGAFEKVSPELAQALKMWITPEVLESFMKYSF